jgi:alkanesulfonate monooxygenase SsuD/methylene tetrahydromethanopterin reductase-like flavin-dependent oxidoreductase (luciferase family)
MVLRKVWTEANASFHGRFFNFDNVTIEPRPAHRDHNNSGTVDLWIGGKSDTALMRTAHLSDAFFASFQAPDEFARSMKTIHRYATEAGRANPHIESGLILLCRLAPTRERAIEEMRPMLNSMGRGGDAFLQRTVFGSPDDIIARLQEYTDVGLDKFVLWPVAEPTAWAGQMEPIGREIANPLCAHRPRRLGILRASGARSYPDRLTGSGIKPRASGSVRVLAATCISRLIRRSRSGRYAIP